MDKNFKEIFSHKYDYIKFIGSGANGSVHLAKNKLLERNEAIKIWKQRDKKDLQMRVEEAKKLSRAYEFPQVPKVYDLEVINGSLTMNMEYLEGPTLKEWLLDNKENNEKLLAVAGLYISNLFEISEKVIHGDAHWGNVLVLDDGTKLFLKILDFGTSIFSKEGYSEKRHWKTINQTISKVLKNVPGYKHYRNTFKIDVKSDSPELQYGKYKDIIEGTAYQSIGCPNFWQTFLK